MKKIAVIIMSLLISAAAFAADNRVKVAVSFNAMAEMVQAVAGNRAEITMIIPDGTEPHDFIPKVGDIKVIKNADVLVINGFSMEHSWLDKSLKAAGNKKLVIVDTSKGAKPISNADHDMVKEKGQYDPHLWLSLKGAEIQSANIKNAMIKVDPAGKAVYEKNYAAFHAQLEKLYTEYSKKFKTVKNKNFVTGHAAFAYFARDFGLRQNSVEDVFAEGEPSARKLKELTDYCRKNHINTIFVETMVSPKVSQTLAREVGAKAQKIYTIASKEDNKDYLASMKANLEMIYQSMK